MLTTGMSMLGKTSVGVRCKTMGDISTMTRAATINVYGRVSAIRTIHIPVPSRVLRILSRLDSRTELQHAAAFPESVTILMLKSPGPLHQVIEWARCA